MNNILYCHGDSVVRGAELSNMEEERFTNLLANKLELKEFNVATDGISNDRIFRNTIRDVSRFITKKHIWCERYGYELVDNISVLIGWTAPTRFEYVGEDNLYKQPRTWMNDTWGWKDKNNTDDDEFILRMTTEVYSAVKTFNNIITLHNFLKANDIKHLFYNSFWSWESDANVNVLKEYDKGHYKKVMTEDFDCNNYFDFETLWTLIPQSYKDLNMISFFRNLTGDYFEERKHPNMIANKMWCKILYDYMNPDYELRPW
jgi:hypothetical protein